MIYIYVLLAGLWMALNDQYTLGGFIFGLGLAILVMSLLRSINVATPPLSLARIGKGVQLAGYFLWELVLANLRVVPELFRPTSELRPGIVGVPLSLTEESQIALLANLVTLTPGTMSLHVSKDRSTLYVHVLRLPEGGPAAVVQDIKQGFERRIQEVFAA
jgi:multicomponent Na+:H+ antiporter subunit E